jgi:hypothetical protein
VRSSTNPTGMLRILISPAKASPNKDTNSATKNQGPD